MCTMYVVGAHRGQKRASDSLEVELQMVVNYQAGAGKQTQVFRESSTCS